MIPASGLVSVAPWGRLGHSPEPHPGGGERCSRCFCWPGSPMAAFPCGDPAGREVRVEAGVRDGRHSWEYFWRGRPIAWRFRDGGA